MRDAGAEEAVRGNEGGRRWVVRFICGVPVCCAFFFLFSPSFSSLTSDLAVDAAHLRAKLGLPLPDHVLGIFFLEHVHEPHLARSGGGGGVSRKHES